MQIPLLIIFIFGLHAHAANLVNLGPDFEVFVNESQGATTLEKLAALKRFESKYQALFDQVVYQKEVRHDWQFRQAKSRGFLFENLPAIQSEMMEFFAKAE